MWARMDSVDGLARSGVGGSDAGWGAMTSAASFGRDAKPRMPSNYER
jgi:hypothetical protein